MSKQRKKFEDYSKPVQVLMILGGLFWGLIALAILSAPNTPTEPKKELTADEMKAGITRSYCRELVLNNVKVKDGAKIPHTRSWPEKLDDEGRRWKYTDNLRAKNAFGVTLEQPFECRVLFISGQEMPLYLKIGNNVLIDKKI